MEGSDISEKEKIQDIPSFTKARSDVENLNALKSAMPLLLMPLKLIGVDTDQMEKALKDTDGLKASVEELTKIPDRFNDQFVPLGWIMYEEMDLQVAKMAIKMAESGDIEGADAYLADYYDTDTVQRMLRRMERVEEFRRRIPLAKKALTDYREERYHACVPVVLALIDGMVNELHLKARGKRLGFSAEDVNLEAWDSVSAHSRGLGQLVPVLMKGRYKTTTQQIFKPYRNGIMHGMDLGYDNKMVAAKTWAALFALRDWAIKTEEGAIEQPPPDKPLELSDLIHQIRENQEDQQLLQKWKPRNIKPGQDIPVSGKSEDYEAGYPEKSLAEFLEYWQIRNYGFMAKKCLSSKSGSKGPASPRDLSLAYSTRFLKTFEFKEVKDQAAAVTVVTAKLVYEDCGQEMKKSFEFRLINLDSDWEVQVRGYPDSRWFILNWDWL
ncbi:MAG: hypothetical protein WAW52_06645 [Methanothrix sp.]